MLVRIWTLGLAGANSVTGHLITKMAFLLYLFSTDNGFGRGDLVCDKSDYEMNADKSP